MSQNSTEAGTVAAIQGGGRGTSIALCVAIGFSLAVLVAGFTVPLYSSETITSDGETISGSDTIVGQNGIGVALALAVPLLISVIVSLLLTRVRWAGALVLAWVITGLLVALNVLAMLSIGIFVLPVTISLCVACALRSR